MKWLFEQYGFNHRAIASTDFNGDLSAPVRRDRAARRAPAATRSCDGLDPEAQRQGVGVGLRRRRRGLEEARRLGAGRRHARRDRIRGRDRARAAGICRSRRCCRRPRRRAPRRSSAAQPSRFRGRQPGPARSVLESRAARRRAPRARHRSDVALLLSGLAAAERVQHRHIPSRSACRPHGRSSSNPTRRTA